MNNQKKLSTLISQRIISQAQHIIPQWQQPEGTPTRHFVVDNLLPDDLANEIYTGFPQDEQIWLQRKSFRERKKTFAKIDAISPLIRETTDAFHTLEVVSAIQKITELPGLEPDPSFYAGGLSMMGKGDFLNPHIDNSHDAKRTRYRRLNLLYYISPNWAPDGGGNLELWNSNVKQPKQIESKFNRLVVMETNRASWHSVNPVLVNRNRCCISNYFFSQNSPDATEYYHVTSFLGRPDQPIRRIYGHIDNRLRQWVAEKLKISRGKHEARYEP